MTSIVIPDSVTSIGIWAFSGCTGLTSLTIGNGVKSIDGSVFFGCEKLMSVTIGSGVMSIDGNAFSGCAYLTSVTFKNTSGWRVFQSSAVTSGTSISSADLSNPATAAGYLTSTYCDYYWKRG